MVAVDEARIRRLVVLRHAKSDWPAGVDDRERPLAAKGRRDAVAAGQWLDAHIGTLDLVLHSDARRTTETCQLVLDAFTRDRTERIDVRAAERIYEAEVPDLMQVLRGVSNHVQTAMLVGHNPGVQELVLNLARPDGGASTALASAKFPTSGLAVLTVPGTWAELGPGQATMEQFVVARG